MPRGQTRLDVGSADISQIFCTDFRSDGGFLPSFGALVASKQHALPTRAQPFEELKPPPPPDQPAPQQPSLAPAPEEESYTERLLRAKKQAWEKRKD